MRDQTAPAFIEPMLLTPGGDLPTGQAWHAQLKMDGARGQLRTRDGSPGLRTRRGRRCDSEFPEILHAAAGMPDTILDGEIVVLGEDGAPDFAALRARLGSRPGRVRTALVRPAVFYAFDVMWQTETTFAGGRCRAVSRCSSRCRPAVRSSALTHSPARLPPCWSSRVNTGLKVPC